MLNKLDLTDNMYNRELSTCSKCGEFHESDDVKNGVCTKEDAEPQPVRRPPFHRTGPNLSWLWSFFNLFTKPIVSVAVFILVVAIVVAIRPGCSSNKPTTTSAQTQPAIKSIEEIERAEATALAEIQTAQDASLEKIQAAKDSLQNMLAELQRQRKMFQPASGISVGDVKRIASSMIGDSLVNIHQGQKYLDGRLNIVDTKADMALEKNATVCADLELLKKRQTDTEQKVITLQTTEGEHQMVVVDFFNEVVNRDKKTKSAAGKAASQALAKINNSDSTNIASSPKGGVMQTDYTAEQMAAMNLKDTPPKENPSPLKEVIVIK